MLPPSKGKPSAQSSQKSKNPVQVPQTGSAKITLPNIPKDFLTFECGINKFQKALENFKVPSNSGYLAHMSSLINLIKSDSSIDADKQTNAYKMYRNILILVPKGAEDITLPAPKGEAKDQIEFLYDLYQKVYKKSSKLSSQSDQYATCYFMLSCLICYIGDYYEKQEKETDSTNKRNQRTFFALDTLLDSLKDNQNDTNQKIQNLTQRMDDLTQNQMDTNKQIGDLKQRMDDQNKKFDELSKKIDNLTKNLSLFLQQQNQAIQDTENKIKVIATAIQSGVQAINNPEFQSLTNPTQ